jgi:hypothetical protein
MSGKIVQFSDKNLETLTKGLMLKPILNWDLRIFLRPGTVEPTLLETEDVAIVNNLRTEAVLTKFQGWQLIEEHPKPFVLHRFSIS